MSNDLREIKQRLLDNSFLIEELLEHLGCEYIKTTSNRIEAQLPEKFGSNNKRSVQVYLNDFLSSKVRSRGVSTDIFGLITYLNHEIDGEQAQEYLYESKVVICNLFGWDEFLKNEIGDDFSEETQDPLAFLRKVQKNRKKRTRFKNMIIKENRVLDKEKTFSWYVKSPHKSFLDDGIDIKTQIEFEVMYDMDTQRVVFPIYNRNGELISIKGRYVGNDKYIMEEMKYLYLFHFDKSIELFNLHRAYEHIKKTGEVIVFESEKSCMKAWQYGFYNTVSIMGNDLSPVQAYLLRTLEANIIFAYDKDIKIDFIKKQASQIRTRKCFYIDDEENLLKEKDSPVDRGEKIWRKLYEGFVKVL